LLTLVVSAASSADGRELLGAVIAALLRLLGHVG
jgi:hypothetical protein